LKIIADNIIDLLNSDIFSITFHCL